MIDGVIGEHYFACVLADNSHGRWVPLFSRPKAYRMRLRKGDKLGSPAWTQKDSFFDPKQVWTIRHAIAMEAAFAVLDCATRRTRNRLNDRGMETIQRHVACALRPSRMLTCQNFRIAS